MDVEKFCIYSPIYKKRSSKHSVKSVRCLNKGGEVLAVGDEIMHCFKQDKNHINRKQRRTKALYRKIMSSGQGK